MKSEFQSVTDTAETRRGFRFSLFVLLVLISLVAVWTAAGIAYKENADLHRKQASLDGLSGRLTVSDETKLTQSAWPNTASDFSTWEIHVPTGKQYNLHLGVGDVSRYSIPTPTTSVPLAPGQHRVTAQIADSVADEYRFVIYLDGETVFDQAMGKEWMPNGWDQASGMMWARPELGGDVAMQLAAARYVPRLKTPPRKYFDANDDELVTNPGYRLWIDAAGTEYPPASAFVGGDGGVYRPKTGLRDGLRLKSLGGTYKWVFECPSLASRQPIIAIEAEFLEGEDAVLSAGTPGFTQWQTGNTVVGSKGNDLTSSVQADVKGQRPVEPVMEFRWETSRPDSVGLRLADVPENSGIDRLRLRVTGGREHLWRLLSTNGDDWLDVRTDVEIVEGARPTSPTASAVVFDFPEPTEEIRFAWKTDHKEPLQYLMQSSSQPQPYTGMNLYAGVPAEFSVELAGEVAPRIELATSDLHPAAVNTKMPGGRIVEGLEIEFSTQSNPWLWLTVRSSLDQQ